jgi:hypothetical protein
VDEFDRADIDAARRLADQKRAGILFDLTRQNDLLLIAAGEIRRLQMRICGTDVIGRDLGLGVLDDGVEFQKGPFT